MIRNICFFVVALAVLLASCGNDELSPYELEAYVEAEGTLTLNRLKSLARSSDLTGEELCRAVSDEMNRFEDQMRETLDIRGKGYQPYGIDWDQTPEQVARRKALKIYARYSDAIDEVDHRCWLALKARK